MYNDYDEYEPRLPQRRRSLSRLKWPVTAAGVLIVLAVRLWPDGPQTPVTKPPRTQTVTLTDWSEVDASVRKACEQARQKAEAHAEIAITRWIAELKSRAETDFLPWYFNYWNQQALALKAVGWHLADTTAAEVLIGEQESAEEKLTAYISDAFRARVLSPEHATHRIETITRDSVEIYLVELSEQLSALQVRFDVPDPDWDSHLRSMAATALAVEANRQIPVLTKAITASAGTAAAKLVQTVIAHVRVLVLRTTGRELLESGFKLGSRQALRHTGWVVTAAVGVWDLVDHQRTVRQNLPVMRQVITDSLDSLGGQVLNDPDNGICSVLDKVRQKTAAKP